MKLYKVLIMALALALALTMSAISFAEDETTDEETTEDTSTLFEDGEWVTLDAMNADIYLPSGWTLLEDGETAATLSDAEGASTLTISLSDFDSDDLETYLTEQGTEYELADTGAALVTGDSDVTVLFLFDDTTLVTMVFTPAEDDDIADSAVDIADTFYIYDVDDEESTDEEEATE